jgi:hypothetical protein
VAGDQRSGEQSVARAASTPASDSITTIVIDTDGDTVTSNPAGVVTRARPTYAARLDDYRIFSTRAAWLAGAVVGLIALAAGDLGAHLFDKGPAWLAAAVLSCIVLAGAFAGTARVQFQWKATILERRIEEGAIDRESRLTDDAESWPRAADRVFNLAFAFTILAGCGFVVLLWITAVG